MEQSIRKIGSWRFRILCGKWLWVAVGIIVVTGLVGVIVAANNRANGAAGAVGGMTIVVVLILIGIRYWLCRYKDNETLQFWAGLRTLQGT